MSKWVSLAGYGSEKREASHTFINSHVNRETGSCYRTGMPGEPGLALSTELVP
jgi:hypothetical protein